MAVGAATLMLAPAALAAVPTYTLSPFAGTGVWGSPPVPGPATSSPFNNPVGDAVGPDGSVYVADTNNQRIEKISPTGNLTVIAGNGTVGTPVAGSALSSPFQELADVAVDAHGNVYAADYDSCVIVKITPAGMLSIVAGDGTCGIPTPGAAPGTATRSHLGYVWGIAVDAAGNLYIGDSTNRGSGAGNHVVEKVTPSGALSIVAGILGPNAGATVNGPATSTHLSSPNGLAVDAAGNLYIADAGNNLVDKVTPAGALSIIAGNGASGAAVNGPATRSPLDQPEAVAVDGAGDVYIADNLGLRVEEVTPDGMLTVIAGNGTTDTPTFGVPATRSGLGGTYSTAGPSGIATTPAGLLYIVANGSGDLVKAAAPSPASTGAPTISGAATVGTTLSASPGSWSNSPVLYGYQWESCNSAGQGCTAIAGATSPGFAVTSSDVDHTLRVVVTAQNGGGSATATSAQTAVVAGLAPAVRHSPAVNHPAVRGHVSVPRSKLRRGVGLSRRGRATVPVVCSGSSLGCSTRATLILRFHRGRHHVVTRFRFNDLTLRAGQTRNLRIHLSRHLLRLLETMHVRRVRVTVVLSGSPTHSLWLRVPRHLKVPGLRHHRRGHRGHHARRGHRGHR